ncbi:UvrD-helicase domain-containing protein [Peribacillus frigoritolerans]|uniref:UvrD-helicase domain-containing protein n=1 Tax=Peribacillus frigoritolerans TaxID=450367 RepID=UPI00399F07F3
MQSKNKVIIAAAGSGKTTYLVEETIKKHLRKILILTFTNKNKLEIIKKFNEMQGYLPSNVEVKTWYSFLLSDCIRPYQKNVYSDKRIDNVFFRDKPANKYIKKSNIEAYYLQNKSQIDKDRISDFAIQCFDKSIGRAIKRLEEIYDYIFIDEVQDMSGYDLDIFQIFFTSKINMVLVGDIRQATFSTSNTPKNKKYRGINIIDFFRDQEKKSKCKIEGLYHSHRCNQIICDFSDNMFSHLSPTKSLNNKNTDHDGIFIIKTKDLLKYREKFNPQVLRYDSRVKIDQAINFGESKGLTFDRVLIKPTKKMEQYLETSEMFLDDVTLAKFYVAVTRARYSVAFISDIESINVNGVTKYTFN